jgi:hypothetical protein
MLVDLMWIYQLENFGLASYWTYTDTEKRENEI